MRDDTAGLFWDDTPAPRVTKPAPPERTPPPRTWEEPGYLPRLEEARACQLPLMSLAELVAAQMAREPLVCDIEIYHNYFIAAFMSVATGKITYVEADDITGLSSADRDKLEWLLNNFLIITFNGNFFDVPLMTLALAGWGVEQIKVAADQIINQMIKPHDLLRNNKVKKLRIDHVDLIKVAPLSASLKVYSGRLHVPRMQELPFRPEIRLSPDQIAITRHYCINDLTATAFLYVELRDQIKLRAAMGLGSGVDLRSKSDAQVAEMIVCNEIERETGTRPERPELPPGTVFKYNFPAFLQYQTEAMRPVMEAVQKAEFRVDEFGEVIPPPELEKLSVEIGGARYNLGIGGLHSCETKVTHCADANHLLIDRDVASYYPAIILNLGLYPRHIGPSFLRVYRGIVERRLAAKKSGNKVEADTLKIAVNGCFGKFGNKWSPLYSPDLMIQVTLTGQLGILMLVEAMEMSGIRVCSANTDGIISKCPKDKLATMAAIIAWWEGVTGFKTEEQLYRSLHARDVNNYIAVKPDGKVKLKGVYSEKGSAADSVLSKNPVNLVCNDAAVAYVKDGTPVAQSIRGCTDIRRFVSVRTVKGGAVKNGEYLGKAIRWYYAAGEAGEIIYASNGHKVPNSEGARPLMDLPAALPDDLDYSRYEAEATAILQEIGALTEVSF